MKNAIEVQNLSKRFRRKGILPPTLFGSVRQWLGGGGYDYFWAVQNMTFSVPRGTTVGLIGPNGSGKSSLLGLVAGTITPTSGTVKTEGRISSLLELGAGFHPDLTGRENVFLNAAILGIAREDIQRRFDHIVGFADLEEFIDMPVKHYSSGMYVRLGFAVAVEVNPDILLVDEVLAVGDIAFQLKCLDRIKNFQRRNKSILLVSHALQTVEEFCQEAYLVHHGALVKQGPPEEVILAYIKQFMGEGGPIFTQEFGTREVEITDVKLRDGSGAECALFESGSTMHIDVHYAAEQRIEKPVFGFSFKTGNGLFIYGSNTQLMDYALPAVEGQGVLRLTLNPLTLLHGNFYLSLSIHSWDHAVQYHRREDWYPFSIKNKSETPGIFQLNAAWSSLPA